MIAYILRRLLATIPVMCIVALFVFSLLYFAPGDPAAIIAGDQASTKDIEQIRQRLGLDQSFGVRFFNWSFDIAQGNFGTSLFAGEPVLKLIIQRMEPTASLMLLTLLLSVLIGVPMGVLAVWAPGSVIDRMIMGFVVAGFSIPVFIVGYLLAYIFSLTLGILPVQGYSPIGRGVGAWLASLILPSLALSFAYIALIARITRAAMLEVLQQDYIRTAHAKGLAEKTVLFVHALKNASIPIVTVIGIGVATLIGGAVVTENVFAIPGIGRLTVDAILRRDYPIIQGVVLLFSFGYLIVNLLVDITYTVFDPRIRY
ncbi:MAG: ABC transporter permease [Alphaproteobacteria bacterium]